MNVLSADAETTAQQLRRVVLEIRRKPYPIADLIPLLDKAAIELEKHDKEHMDKFLSNPTLWTI